jgi:hypothetical protein
MPGMTDTMPQMVGAHKVHAGRHGGAFFMAPDKVHHIEAKYSVECGMQVFVYNAFTDPISVTRFQGLYRIIPEDEKEWDKKVMRFLSPEGDGAFLHAPGDHDITGPFKIELYMKFPESDDAELFNVPTDQTPR